MKILLVSPFFDSSTNGTFHFPNFLLKINELYPEHQVSVLTEDIKHLPNKSYENVYPITVHYPRPIHGIQTLLRNFTYWKAIKALQKIKFFDVIIFNAGLLGVWTRRQLPQNIPMFGFINDDNGLLLERNNHSTWRKYIHKYLEFNILEKSFILQKNTTVLCHSNYMRQLAIQKCHSTPDKILCFYLAVDVFNIPYQHPKALKGNVKIMFVKADYRRGGLFELGQALGQLQNDAFELTVIGIPKHDFNGVHDFFAKFSNIKLNLHNYVTRSDMEVALGQHDIFCTPARAESLGLANVQALASGLSVVATQVGGIPEVMNGTQNGWLAKPNNPDSLATALKTCIEAPLEERIQKSQLGRKWVEQHFDYKVMLKNFVTLIQKQ